jgi:hypothetical protein
MSPTTWAEPAWTPGVVAPPSNPVDPGALPEQPRLAQRVIPPTLAPEPAPTRPEYTWAPSGAAPAAPEVLPDRMTKRDGYGAKPIYGYDVPAAQRGEFGRAIFSDSLRGATPKGLNEDIAAHGQGVSGAPDWYNGINVSQMGPAEIQALKAQTGQEASDLAAARQYYAMPEGERGSAPASVARAMAPGVAPSLAFGMAAEERERGAAAEGQKQAVEIAKTRITSEGKAAVDQQKQDEANKAAGMTHLKAPDTGAPPEERLSGDQLDAAHGIYGLWNYDPAAAPIVRKLAKSLYVSPAAAEVQVKAAHPDWKPDQVKAEVERVTAASQKELLIAAWKARHPQGLGG